MITTLQFFYFFFKIVIDWM